MSEIIYGNESLLWRWRLVYDGQTEKNINVNGVRELEIKKGETRETYSRQTLFINLDTEQFSV